MFVRVVPDGTPSWFGVFAFGSPGGSIGFSGVFSCPNPHDLCVASSWLGVVARADDYTKWTGLRAFPITDVRPCLDAQLLLLVDCTRITAWGRDGVLWRTDPRITASRIIGCPLPDRPAQTASRWLLRRSNQVYSPNSRTTLAFVLLSLGASTRATGQMRCDTIEQQQPMNWCNALQAKRSMALLDTLVDELEKRLTPPHASDLQAVEAQWQMYRDAHCRWQAAFFTGGSIQPAVLATCYDEVTWNRIDELKLDLCEGQGMTGDCDASRRYDRPEGPD
jgi:uncharacterized protein YecT (DUF1311 family)